MHMKPWFEKEKQEADIIKFPEPERKVIKMPSVSEYPDFITGVLDLQARRDQGQIGQDSYDKLYQDLIHRFMKKESFDTPWFLREQESKKLINGTTRGVFNEIIMAAALATRFVKNDTIDQGDVRKVMDNLRKSKTKTIVMKNNENDPIQLEIQDKGPTVIADLEEPKNLDIMQDTIEGNVLFANSDEIATKTADLYDKNGKPDEVHIIQKGGERSKVDVALVYMPGKKVIKGYSAKSYSNRLDNKDVNTLSKVQEYFSPLNVNIDISKYTELDRQISATKTFTDIFKQIGQQLKSQLGGDNDKNELNFINNLIEFIKQKMTGGEDLILVDIAKGSFTTHGFERLVKNLNQINLTVDLKKQSATSKQPELYVYDSKLGPKSGLLVLLRYNMIAPKPGGRTGRHRIFVEGGNIFKSLSLLQTSKK